MTTDSAGNPNARLARVRELLLHPCIRDDLRTHRLMHRLAARRFNLFDALRVDRKENHHSRFLGYLLDPEGWHDQGPVFLVGLLAHLRDHHDLAPGTVDFWTDYRLQQTLAPTAQVTVEKDTGGEGRIDLVIELGDGTVIAIENKVDAGEQEQQLARYWRWLKSLGKRGDRLLVFLTPNGDSGTTAGADDRVACLSYRHVADILEQGLAQCPETAAPLIGTVRQYVQLCRRIAGEPEPMTELSPQIVELLKDPRHLAAALDVRDHLERVQQDIKLRFWELLRDALEKKLADSEARHR